MCLTVFPKSYNDNPTHEDLIPKVADKPIEVYKALFCVDEGYKGLFSGGSEYETPYRCKPVRFFLGRSVLKSGGMSGIAGYCDGEETLPALSSYVTVKWRGKKLLHLNEEGRRIYKDFGRMKPYSLSIDRGIHAYRRKPTNQTLSSILRVKLPWQHLVVLKGIIPKGTKYFEGISGDIVADKMILYKNKEVCV